MIVLVATGGGDDPASVPSPTPSPTAAPAPSPSPTRTAIAPLTGEPVAPDVLERPVVAVKVENSPPARPQEGLDDADVVYEQIVEGGVTRFIALYQSEIPTVVGPVRSARLVDVDVLPAYSPIFAFSGAREDVLRAVDAAGIAAIIDDGVGGFIRDPGRPSSHDLMLEPEVVYERGRDRPSVAPLDGPVWAYADEPPAEPTAEVTDVELPITSANTAGWSFDEDAGVYRRSQNGEPSAVVGEGRIGAANVIALGTEVFEGGCCDTAGNPFVVSDVTGEGQGWLFRDGRGYAITWRKAAAGRHMRILDEDGDALPLKPGATWIHVMDAPTLPTFEPTEPS